MKVGRSSFDYAETLKRLDDAIARRGLTVFARIDHAAGAREIGVEIPPEEVVLFGNPAAGTPLMQSDPRVGIELPLRILIWEEEEGVALGYNDPRELAARYDLSEQVTTLGTMANLLGEVVTEASG